jgi:predicted nucleic-acid-binding protein
MTGLDTNVLVRYLTQDDLAQARKANSLIDGAVGKGERLHLDVVVLCELVCVLRGAYRFGKQTVTDAVGKILDAAQFSIEDRDLLREALDAYRGGQGDFADYVLGLRNRMAGCGATVTFDRSLKRNALFTVL